MYTQQQISAAAIKGTGIGSLGYLFQPVVNFNRTIVGFEALARCSVLPNVSVYSGTADLISHIPFSVQAKEFCRSVSTLVAVFGGHYIYSFNVEPRDCTIANLELLCDLCSRYRLKRHLIELELIETSSIDLPGIALEKAKESGFSIALDDFGVGYSNVGALLHYPFDKIKFDRLFLSKDSGSLSKEMLQAIHSVVKRRGFKTVIEGVENEQLLSFVDTLGATFYQGWFFGSGFSVEDLVKQKNCVRFK